MNPFVRHFLYIAYGAMMAGLVFWLGQQTWASLFFSRVIGTVLVIGFGWLFGFAVHKMWESFSKSNGHGRDE